MTPNWLMSQRRLTGDFWKLIGSFFSLQPVFPDENDLVLIGLDTALFGVWLHLEVFRRVADVPFPLERGVAGVQFALDLYS